MQIIIGIFVLGGIILPFIFKVLGKAEEKVENVADAIEPDSVLGKIVGAFALIIFAAIVIFSIYIYIYIQF